MTNEQLASFIKQGGNNELIPLLWERVRKLVNLLANRYFKAYAYKLTACGITVEDMRQTGYFAFKHAVNTLAGDGIPKRECACRTDQNC